MKKLSLSIAIGLCLLGSGQAFAGSELITEILGRIGKVFDVSAESSFSSNGVMRATRIITAGDAKIFVSEEALNITEGASKIGKSGSMKLEVGLAVENGLLVGQIPKASAFSEQVTSFLASNPSFTIIKSQTKTIGDLVTAVSIDEDGVDAAQLAKFIRGLATSVANAK